MKATGLLVVAALLVAALVRPSAASEGPLPPTIVVDQQSLTLQGQGVRTKFLVPIYAGGLYVEAPFTDPQALIAADAPMAIRMQMLFGD